ncbi:retrovirus-related pol polyprotein from transposon TNT 1-94 [Tanacetum coccineum]
MDVKMIFLNGGLTEDAYMCQPEGFVNPDNNKLVCKLNKSIYGLKQASRQWNIKFHNVVSSFGFVENIVDQCIYLKNFDMKDMGEASYVIGIEIHRDGSRKLLSLSQKSYINKVLERFRMRNCSSISAPLVKGETFSLDQCPKNAIKEEEMRNISYASLVGRLMYAVVCNRLDLTFSVGMLRCKDIGKSTSGYIFLLAEGGISWRSVKQSLIASSTMEVEFIACYEATSQALWLRNFISDLRIVDTICIPLKIFCDNSAAIFFSKNNKSGTGSKHIDIKYLKVRYHVGRKEVSIVHINTESMIADPMTKGLLAKVFQDHVTRMGLINLI